MNPCEDDLEDLQGEDYLQVELRHQQRMKCVLPRCSTTGSIKLTMTMGLQENNFKKLIINNWVCKSIINVRLSKVIKLSLKCCNSRRIKGHSPSPVWLSEKDNNFFYNFCYKSYWALGKGSKKKLGKSGQADRLGWPPPPPKRSGKCENFSTSCHIWGYFVVL